MRLARILLLVACALTTKPAFAGDIEDLAGLLAGTFDSALHEPDQPPDQRMVDSRIRLDLPNLGAYVFYQQINHQQDLTVYRQRVLVLSDSSGRLEQRAYAIREPEWYVDAGARAFDRITFEDLEEIMSDSCEQVWTRKDDGFRGYVDPERCVIISSRTGKKRRIEAESYVSRDKLLLAERGYDAETGEQLFGSATDEFRSLGRGN